MLNTSGGTLTRRLDWPKDGILPEKDIARCNEWIAEDVTRAVDWIRSRPEYFNPVLAGCGESVQNFYFRYVFYALDRYYPGYNPWVKWTNILIGCNKCDHRCARCAYNLYYYPLFQEYHIFSYTERSQIAFVRFAELVANEYYRRSSIESAV